MSKTYFSTGQKWNHKSLVEQKQEVDQQLDFRNFPKNHLLSMQSDINHRQSDYIEID